MKLIDAFFVVLLLQTEEISFCRLDKSFEKMVGKLLNPKNVEAHSIAVFRLQQSSDGQGLIVGLEQKLS